MCIVNNILHFPYYLVRTWLDFRFFPILFILFFCQVEIEEGQRREESLVRMNETFRSFNSMVEDKMFVSSVSKAWHENVKRL